MNEFTAKKLGGALAFAGVLIETLESSKDLFKTNLGEEAVENIITNLKTQKDSIHTLADRVHELETVFKKFEKVEERLKNMRDVYIGDSKDKPNKVFGWMSFFLGGAISNWYIIEGASENLAHPELKALSMQATDLYKDLRDKTLDILRTSGMEKSSN